MSPDLRIVFVTAPTEQGAKTLARTLVEEGLAACGNVVPGLTSLFRWEGAIQEEAEALLLLKTTTDRLEELIGRTVALHPYDVPEVIAVPIDAGYGPYLRWVAEGSSAP